MNLLYLVHRVPYPPDKGDRIRAYHLLRFLSRRANVHLACLADEPVTEETRKALASLCRRVAIFPVDKTRWLHALASVVSGHSVTEGAFWSPGLRKTLEQWSADTRYHAAVAFSSSMVPYLRLPSFRDVPAVVDLVDVDSEKWLEYVAASRPPRRWIYALEGRRLRRLEAGLPSWARAITFVSDAEANLYRRFAPPGPVYGIPNGVDLEYFQPQPASEELSCVFVGALDYKPNVDGAAWFCEHVWPAVYNRHPRSKLYLVGRRPVPAVVRLGRVPGVEVVGQVPDVRPYVARAAVSVNPLRIARGVQNKVLEALAMARAVIGSPEALTGLGVEPEREVLAAATPAEWIAAVERLFADAGLRRRLGEAGRRYTEEHHRWDSCLGPFAELLELTTPTRSASEGHSLARASG